MHQELKTALTIAGSDPSGGAGIQRDLLTFHDFGVHGVSVITSITIQDATKLHQNNPLSAELVYQQAKTILERFNIKYVKLGLLCNLEIMGAIDKLISNDNNLHIILDPIISSSSGYNFLSIKEINFMRSKLFPKSFLITPNIPEAEQLSNQKINSFDDRKDVAKRLYDFGCSNVLIKGGHSNGLAIDLL